MCHLTSIRLVQGTSFGLSTLLLVLRAVCIPAISLFVLEIGLSVTMIVAVPVFSLILSFLKNTLIILRIKSYNINKINLSEYFWDPKTLQYSGVNNGKVLYRDNIHLSQFGASTIAGSIADKIFKYNSKNF